MKTALSLLLIAVALALASTAHACPLAISSCYSAPVYAAPIVSYAQPVYAPVQAYVAPQQAQLLIQPGTVTVTQPQVSYSVQQVQGYAAYSPVQQFVAPSYSLGVQSHGYVQGFSGHHVQRFSSEDNRVQALRVGPLGGSVTVQKDGDVIRRGPLGRVLSIRKN